MDVCPLSPLLPLPVVVEVQFMSPPVVLMLYCIIINFVCYILSLLTILYSRFFVFPLYAYVVQLEDPGYEYKPIRHS